MTRPHDRIQRHTCLMLVIELTLLAIVIWRFAPTLRTDQTSPESAVSSDQTSAIPDTLTHRDVLPTPTHDDSAPPRMIAFPGALMSAPIVPAGRVAGTWETRHLGDSVGHLVGTSWLDDPGGNIVLAGHVENASGNPGPFAHLFEAHVGDIVVLREGLREVRYAVTSIVNAAPNDVSYVAQDGRPRVTLITCTDWDYEDNMYNGRLVVIAEPIPSSAQAATPTP